MNDLSSISLGDIDIDTGDRKKLLSNVKHVPATVSRGGKISNHNTGVYFHSVPVNPFTKTCTLSYDQAESLDFYKIDILNNHIYDGVKSETHLTQLLETPPMWELLEHQEVVNQITHINNHFDLVKSLKPRSILQMAMLLAMIRPAKRYLVNKCLKHGWASLEPEIWEQDNKDLFAFKKSHSIAYAHLVVIDLNLLVEKISSNQNDLALI